MDTQEQLKEIKKEISYLKAQSNGIERDFDHFKNNYYNANQKQYREDNIKQLALQLLNTPLWDNDRGRTTPRLRIMAAIDMAIFFEENIAIKVK